MLRKFLLNLANPKNSSALGNAARRKRMQLFEQNFPEINQKEVTILDMGGTVNFWRQMGYLDKHNCKITLVNLQAEPSNYSNITSLSGNVCSMPDFKDKSFDIVFSNSVIEHVGKFEKQKMMAEEVRRIGKRYYLQTPNYWFPFEPHFLTPFFQYLPVFIRAWMIRNFNLGWHHKTKEKAKSYELANSIELLSKGDMKKLFPDSRLVLEKFAKIFNKSLIVIK